MSDPPGHKETPIKPAVMTQRRKNKKQVYREFVSFTCHKVSKPDGGQGDDHKVEGLQCRPALDVFKDGCRQRHKQQAAEQYKQQRGYDSDLGLADGPVLQGK